MPHPLSNSKIFCAADSSAFGPPSPSLPPYLRLSLASCTTHPRGHATVEAHVPGCCSRRRLGMGSFPLEKTEMVTLGHHRSSSRHGEGRCVWWQTGVCWRAKLCVCVCVCVCVCACAFRIVLKIHQPDTFCCYVNTVTTNVYHQKVNTPNYVLLVECRTLWGESERVYVQDIHMTVHGSSN